MDKQCKLMKLSRSLCESFESCRATSLLAELEHDEELPVGHEVEENEEDCNDSEDCSDNYGEEGLYSKAGKMHRVWEPTYVIVYREVYRWMKPLCHLRFKNYQSPPAPAVPWTRFCSK